VTRPDLAIVGGGLLGRCLAWRASRAGARVVLYDAASHQGENSAAWVAAGMIAPMTEAIDAGAEIASMGTHSLSLWSRWMSELPVPVFFRDNGTLLLWHSEDAREAVRAQRRFPSSQTQMSIKRIVSARIREMEPALATRFPEALYISNEAQIDNRAFLKAVSIALAEAGVECHWETFVKDGALLDAGFVVDCRGMGAKRDWAKLRGVRGEIVRLHAPDIELHHMLRLLHPHHPVYIVPRPEGNLVIGATCIESEDRSPVSVRGVLELLSSAYSLIPALAEARVLEFNTQVRPALPDNLPALRFDRERKALYLNGLYRHGFLLTPAIVEEVLGVLSIEGQSSGLWPSLWQNYVETSADIQTSNESQTCLSL
jgi:glycine oxidase